MEDKEETSSVPVPEEFQKKAVELVNSCNSEESLSFISNLVYKKQDEIRMAKTKKGKKSVPSEYSLEEAPKD